MTNDKQREDLLPLEKVLDDMYQDKGIVSMAARDYYKLHYATEEEKRAMDRQDKITTIFAASIWLFLIAGFVFCIISEVLKYV